MSTTDKHALAGQVRKLHTFDATVNGRDFRIVDWAERIVFDDPHLQLAHTFIERGSKSEFAFNKFPKFDPLTYNRAVFGYIDNDPDKPFLVDQDEICDIKSVMDQAFSNSVAYHIGVAVELRKKTDALLKYSGFREGNEQLKSRVSQAKVFADNLCEILAAGRELLETEEGVSRFRQAVPAADSLWRALQAMSDSIHDSGVADREAARLGWMKHCDFYCHFGRPDYKTSSERDDSISYSVLEGLSHFIVQALKFRNQLRADSTRAKAQMDWLVAFTSKRQG